MKKAIKNFLLAVLLLLLIYLGITALVSDTAYALSQFKEFWYYILALAVGFGIQIALYTLLKEKVKNAKGVVATTAATSTAAMISCCTHYLVNVLPLLGAVGLVTIVAQYQIELFWVGIAFNLAGIVYMYTQFKKHSRMV